MKNIIIKYILALVIVLGYSSEILAGNCDTVCAYTTSKKYYVSGVSNATGYKWTSTAGISIVSGQGSDTIVVNFSTATPGNAQICVKPYNTCDSMAASCFNVFIQATPSKPNAGADQTVCSGATLTTTATGTSGVLYSWSGPSGFTATTATISLSNSTTAMTGSYILNTSIKGCMSTPDTVLFTVNQTPAKPNAGSDITVCSGSSINLTSTATSPSGGSYSWTGPNGYTSTSQNPSIANSTTAMSGSYIITHTLTGCPSVSPDTVVVTVNQTPAKPNAGGDQSICEATTLSFTATGAATATFNWTGPSGYTATGATVTRLNATATMSGNYYLSQTVNGCPSVSPDTVYVLVKSRPAKPNAGTDVIVCKDSTFSLSASGDPSATFSWTGPNGYTATGASVTRTGAQTSMSGNYIVTQTVNGCSSLLLDTQAVNVVVSPTIATGTTTAPTTCTTANGSFTINGLVASTTYSVTYSGPSGTNTLTLASNASGIITVSGLGVGIYNNVYVRTITGSCPSNIVGPYTLAGPAPTGTPVIQCK